MAHVKQEEPLTTKAYNAFLTALREAVDGSKFPDAYKKDLLIDLSVEYLPILQNDGGRFTQQGKPILASDALPIPETMTELRERAQTSMTLIRDYD
jgi:hypothetical protein